MRVAARVGFTMVKLRIPAQVWPAPSLNQRLPEAPFANKPPFWESHMALCSHVDWTQRHTLLGSAADRGLVLHV